MKLELSTDGGNTYTDVTPFIANGGLQWDLNSVDADGAGRSLDGVMHRIQIGHKDKLSVKCIPMGTDDLNSLQTILKTEWLKVRLTTNTGAIIKTMYPGATKSATLYGTKRNGTELWQGFSYSLIEQ